MRYCEGIGLILLYEWGNKITAIDPKWRVWEMICRHFKFKSLVLKRNRNGHPSFRVTQLKRNRTLPLWYGSLMDEDELDWNVCIILLTIPNTVIRWCVAFFFFTWSVLETIAYARISHDFEAKLMSFILDSLLLIINYKVCFLWLGNIYLFTVSRLKGLHQIKYLDFNLDLDSLKFKMAHSFCVEPVRWLIECLFQPDCWFLVFWYFGNYP